ncbi:glycosyltransferase family 39 protein [Candidatus Pacearchaeota archaeon]|nr:glycosyltransferase family 39 protein [Candidatus Pacearchaeota archaeon]
MENSEQVIESRKEKLKSRFSNWLKDSYNYYFFIIFLISLGIGLWIFFKTLNQPLWYDGASYLATAKKWAFDLNTNNIWYYRRGFFWPLFSAIFFKLGLGEAGIRFTILLFASGIVAISYLLISLMFSKKYAFFASLLTAFSWILLFFTGRILTDIPAAFFLLTALFFFWKGYMLKHGNKFIYLFALFLGLSFLTRMQTMMFIPPFIIAVLSKEKLVFLKNKTLWKAFGIFLILMIPHLVLYSLHYGNPVKDLLSYYLGIGTEVPSAISEIKTISKLDMYLLDIPYIVFGGRLAPPGSSMSSLFLIIFFILSLLFFADLILGIDKVFQNENIQNKLFALAWILSPFLALGYITEIVEERYVLSTLPFLFLIILSAVFWISGNISNYLKSDKKNANVIIFIILLVILVPNFMWGKSLIENKKDSYLEVRQSGLWLKQNSNPGDIVITNSIPQIVYYSDRPAYGITQLGINDSSFTQNITELKPRFLMLSIFEAHDPWMYAYPEIHNDTLTPVKLFYQGKNPVSIIYEFKYK